VPDTNLTAPNAFLISSFTISRKLRREGLTATFHTLEVYACGCILDLSPTEETWIYTPCGIHELPAPEKDTKAT
jgi:hypothetical protein